MFCGATLHGIRKLVRVKEHPAKHTDVHIHIRIHTHAPTHTLMLFVFKSGQLLDLTAGAAQREGELRNGTAGAA